MIGHNISISAACVADPSEQGTSARAKSVAPHVNSHQAGVPVPDFNVRN
jgi:hypothetical protein